MARMMMTTVLGLTAGCVAAASCLEAFGGFAFPESWTGTVVCVAVSAGVGAAQGALVRALPPKARGVPSLAIAGAVFAGFTALLFVRVLTAWTSLSVFGAGPAGRLAVLVLPFSQAMAGLLLGALAAGEDERAAR